ncbi:MAG: gamma-glutamylcyclotransferase [Geminicoccaceae bacterium]|jgi:cation transport protein ChaC|nr:MAG: gamma-glutamylcyclotransferase [Geminicoccaceae bacterium]
MSRGALPGAEDPPPAELVWIFGYGSLMWRPDFPFLRSAPARLEGWHRALCIRSEHWRGTPERPGCVLGLAPGGSCVGRAFAVAPEAEAAILEALDARENVRGYLYERRRLPIVLLDTGAAVPAWTYLARTADPRSERDLPRAELVRRLRTAHGRGGSNLDYLRETVAHLLELGIREAELEELLAEALGEVGTTTPAR